MSVTATETIVVPPIVAPVIVRAPEPAAPAAAPAAPAATSVGTSQRSWVDAAYEVLPADGSSASVAEILSAIGERGLRDYSQAKTPYQTLARDLRNSARKASSRVQQTAPGRFARR